MTAHYDTRGDVAVLQLDNPPVNGLGLATRLALGRALERALADPQVRVVVLTGTGRVFSGGADIHEFETAGALAEPNLLTLIERFEGSPKPVIAAINGVCVGGGLELALGCHYRIATPHATLGLPEVRLGLVPGAGGTQRLPRAIGAAAALRMIVSGEPIDAEQAQSAGLVERIVSDKSFQGVLDFAHELEGGTAHLRIRDCAVALPAGTTAAGFFATARQQVAASARGQIAPLHCVDCIEAAVLRPFDEGLAYERSTFVELIHGEQSRALRHAFFAERAAAKIPGVAESTPARPIHRAAVVGFGTMGGGIAMCFAHVGIPVRILETHQAAIDRGLATCRANWEATARKGRLTDAQVATRLALLQPTLDAAALRDADIVVEAAYEDMAVKQSVFGTLDRVMRPGAILASNTSSLDLDRIAAFTQRPQDVVGMHFFSPANVMRLLEVVRGKRTASDVLATVMQLARRLRKVAVVAGVCDGFIGNRMVEQYGRQALFLIDEGATPAQIDAALTGFGMAMGPLAMADLAGLDIGHAIRQRRAAEQSPVTYSAIADRIVAAGRLGQKSGAGWYRYEPGRRVPLPDPQVDEIIAAHRSAIGVTPREIADEEIVERCIFALVNEGAHLLEEGIAQRSGDIDVVYLTGYGFPAYRGGPMFYALARGFKQVIGRMRAFAANAHADPAFWTPAPLLLQAAERGRWD